MGFATYEFYTETYKGTLIPATDFDELSERASEYISSRIIQEIPEEPPIELQKCACRVAEIAYVDAHNLNPRIASETVGGYSRSFESTEANYNLERRYDFAIKTMLGKTGLLYRGIG